MAHQRTAGSYVGAMAVLILGVTGPMTAAGQVPPRYTVNRSLIFAVRMVDPPVLVLSSPTALVGIDPATGLERWVRSDLVNTSVTHMKELLSTRTDAAGAPAELAVPQLSVERISGTQLGLVTAFHGKSPGRVEVIDLASGAQRWDSRSVTADDVAGAFPLPDDSLLLLVVRPRDSQSPTVIGVDVLTGKVRWHRKEMFSRNPPDFGAGVGRLGLRTSVQEGPEPLMDSDTSAIFFLTQNEVVRINLRTGETIWRQEVRGARPLPQKIRAAEMVLVNGKLLVPYERSLAALDPGTGLLLWRTRSRMPGYIAQLEGTPAGLLVRGIPIWDFRTGQSEGRPFLDLLDPSSGASLWPESTRKIRYSTNFLRTETRTVIGQGSALLEIDMATGQPTQVADLQVQGDDTLRRLEPMDRDVLGFGIQNLTRVDSLGAIRFHTYVPPPGPTFFHPEAHATQAWHDDFVVLLADSLPSGGGRGLVKVAKASGAITAELPLRDRTPAYLVDPALGLILVLDQDDILRAYPF